MTHHHETDDSTSNIAIMSAALGKNGFTWTDTDLDERPYRQFYKEGIPRWLTYWEPSLTYPTTHRALNEISRNKTAAYEYVAQLGYRTPRTVTVTRDNRQTESIQRLLTESPRVVVKPVYGSLSRGVVRGNTSASQIESVLDTAFETDKEVIVQEQVFGEEVRFVLIGGTLRAAILRQRPQVVGDGSSSVRELIDLENESRRSIHDVMVSYPLLDETNCDMTDVDYDSIPSEGQVVVLGYGSMIMNGASMYDIVDTVHPAYRSMTEHIARSLAADFIVIDVIISDVHSFDDYAFLEFNTSPVLRLFYSCRDGKHFDAASLLANLIEARTSQPLNIL